MSKSFPKLFALSQIPDGSIKNAWNQETLDWDIQPRRLLRDREIVSWNTVKDSFTSPHDSRGYDCPIWKHTTNGTFQTMALKEVLHNQTTRPNPPLGSECYKKLWKSYIPKKCKFFLLVIVSSKYHYYGKPLEKASQLFAQPQLVYPLQKA